MPDINDAIAAELAPNGGDSTVTQNLYTPGPDPAEDVNVQVADEIESGETP